MQIQHLVKTIDELSDEELLVRIREIRHSRTILNPGSVAPKERKEKRVTRARITGAEKLLANMSEEDRQKLIEQLTSEDSND